MASCLYQLGQTTHVYKQEYIVSDTRGFQATVDFRSCSPSSSRPRRSHRSRPGERLRGDCCSSNLISLTQIKPLHATVIDQHSPDSTFRNILSRRYGHCVDELSRQDIGWLIPTVNPTCVHRLSTFKTVSFHPLSMYVHVFLFLIFSKWIPLSSNVYSVSMTLRLVAKFLFY